MDRAEQLAALSGPAADQWGLITAAQAKSLGLSAVQLLRLTEAGLLDNVSRGVYLIEASGMPRHVDIKAAWLRLEPAVFAWDRPPGHRDSGVISHASACQLHELGDIPAPNVEITVPRRRTTTEPFVRLRTAPLNRQEITVVDGLPVTTATRTIIDLLQAKADGGHIGGVIADAHRRDLINLDELADRLQPYARKYGLKANATGHDLISHLVEQAGESLTRQEVVRAGKEGFDTAVRLLAEHPDLAPYLVDQLHEEAHADYDERAALAARLLSTSLHTHSTSLSKTIQEMNQRLARPGLDKTLRDINRKLSQPNPALTEVVRKLSQPNPALTEVVRKLSQPNPALTEAMRKLSQANPAIAKVMRDAVAPPVTRKALGHAAAPQRLTSSPVLKNDQESDDSSKGSSEGQESN